MGIQADLAKGKYGENKVIECFEKHRISPNYNSIRNSKDFDLFFYCYDIQYTIEVKYDIKCLETGNIAVEYFNSKSCKPSGITATKSNLWCFVLQDDSIWIVNTENLKKYIKNNKPKRIVNGAGDGNADLMLYDKDTILSQFARIDNLSSSEFTTTIKQQLGILT